MTYAGDGLFIYLSEISVEGVTEFKYTVTLDGANHRARHSGHHGQH